MSKGLRIALIASVGVVLLGLIGGGVFMYMQFTSKVDKAIADKIGSATPAEGASGTDTVTASFFFKTTNFVTELADPAPKVRYVDVTINLGFAALKDAEDAKTYEPVIRNTVLQILRAKTATDLSGAQGMTNLEKEITDALLKLAPLSKTLKKTLVVNLVIQ